MKLKVLLFTGAVLTSAAHSGLAQEIKGKAINNVDMKNGLILSGTSGIGSNRPGSVINSILVGPRGIIHGDAVNTVVMKNALILADSGSVINSIAVGVPR